MKLSEKQEFSYELKKLMNVYNRTADADLFSVWYNAFEKHDMAEIKAAFSEYVVNEKFPPIPAGVMPYIKSRVRKISADEAWDYIPKTYKESGYMTRRMLQSLGVVEGLIVANDWLGARLAFVNTYNSLPADDEWTYSQAYGIEQEEKEQRKLNDLTILRDKRWTTKEKLTALDTNKQLMIGGGSKNMMSESERKRGKESISTILTMLNSSQKATGLD